MAERLVELGAVLIGLAVLARLASRVGIPTIPLYLIAGLAFGKGGALPLVTTQEFIQTGSEIGLILLLFMLGLEYSASELVRTMKRTARAGVLDLLLNFTPGLVAGLVLGWGLIPSLFLAGITLVTSSGIASKMLSDCGWNGTPEARYVVSIAVIEDLTMAAYLPVLGVLVLGGATLAGIGSATIAIVGVAIVLALAMRVEVGISKLIFSRSDEALLLTILGLAVLVAGVAELVGVSAAVGALIAGIVMSGPAAHGARQLIRPLRDLFAALFFAFIGLSVDPADLVHMVGPAIALAAAGSVTKLGTGWVGGTLAGLDPAQRLRAGLIMIPRGEFSIAIAGLAVAANLDSRIAPLTVAYVLTLAVLGPLAVRIELYLSRRRAPVEAFAARNENVF
jgi:K+:H+ antiporter subunit KhtU